MLRAFRRWSARRRLGWLLASPGIVFASPLSTVTVAHAQVGLDAARKLFTEALADEQAERFQIALDKYREVGRVKDTAPVRFRIGMCLESLGHLAEAAEAYRAANALAKGDPEQRKVERASGERLASVTPRLAHLAVVLEGGPYTDLEVQVDGRVGDSVAIATPDGIVVDPGRHTLHASAAGTTPFSSEVALGEGGRSAITVRLVPDAPRAAPPPPVPIAVAPPPSHARRTAGFVTLGVGAAFVAGGAIALVVRENSARTVVDACPESVCPLARKSEIEAAKSRAAAMGPLGGVLGGLGLVGLGVGTYLVLTSPSAPSGTSAGGVALRLTPTLGGVELGGRW